MDKEPDAGYLLVIKLLLGVPALVKLWNEDEDKLPYIFMASVIRYIESNSLNKDDIKEFVNIINETYQPSLGPIGINNFLGAGFLEYLYPSDNENINYIVSMLRPELVDIYKKLN